MNIIKNGLVALIEETPQRLGESGAREVLGALGAECPGDTVPE